MKILSLDIENKIDKLKLINLHLQKNVFLLNAIIWIKLNKTCTHVPTQATSWRTHFFSFAKRYIRIICDSILSLFSCVQVAVNLNVG